MDSLRKKEADGLWAPSGEDRWHGWTARRPDPSQKRPPGNLERRAWLTMPLNCLNFSLWIQALGNILSISLSINIIIILLRERAEEYRAYSASRPRWEKSWFKDYGIIICWYLDSWSTRDWAYEPTWARSLIYNPWYLCLVDAISDMAIRTIRLVFLDWFCTSSSACRAWTSQSIEWWIIGIG